MITLRMIADVKEDRHIVLTLPPEVPTGKAELVVTVESRMTARPQPWGVPAAEIRGIGAGICTPPDDDAVERWIDERRAEKYG